MVGNWQMHTSVAERELLLSVRDLHVHYLTPRGPVRVVDGVSFDIAHGEVLGLAGESGSGKSTLAQAILRVLQPPAVITGGAVRYGDRDVLDMSDEELAAFRWRQVSMVFQSAMNALNPLLTVRDQLVDTILAHEAVSRREAWARAAELLDLVGIERARLAAYPHQLSGGMRQRVAIAIALALNPPLMILDEPTTALDVVLQREIMSEIEALRGQLGFSLLFITHDLSLLVEIATRIAVMYAGQIVEVASARTLFDRPLHPYTQGLIASFPGLGGTPAPVTGIPGAPPSLLRPPSGCRFHPRCPECKPVFTQLEPQLVEVERDHWVACHLYTDVGLRA
jgi:peptide/nickel transport system ATP-binding protein